MVCGGRVGEQAKLICEMGVAEMEESKWVSQDKKQNLFNQSKGTDRSKHNFQLENKVKEFKNVAEETK